MNCEQTKFQANIPPVFAVNKSSKAKSKLTPKVLYTWPRILIASSANGSYQQV